MNYDYYMSKDRLTRYKLWCVFKGYKKATDIGAALDRSYGCINGWQCGARRIPDDIMKIIDREMKRYITRGLRYAAKSKNR